MFQNFANLFVLKFKCATFQTKKNLEKITSGVMGFWKKNPKFSNWNRIFFWFCKKSCECSKIPKIYLSWNSSVRSFRKKKFLKKWLWSNRNLKKNSQFFNLKLDFFLIFQKKHQKTRKFKNFIYCEPHLSKFWAKSEKLFSGRSVRRAGGRGGTTTRFARGC